MRLVSHQALCVSSSYPIRALIAKSDVRYPRFHLLDFANIMIGSEDTLVRNHGSL